MIIGVLNRKGGVGKTTVAINVAATLAVAGGRVLLVDADPQESALSWSSRRERDPLFSVVGMASPTLHRELPRIAPDYDVVMIDGAPGAGVSGAVCSDREQPVASSRPASASAWWSFRLEDARI